MASLTKLRRRLLRWERYALRIGYRFGDRWQGCYADGGAFGNGLDRAAGRVFFEIGRREARAVYWPTTGMPPSVPEFDGGCCKTGAQGHEGPCVTSCRFCFGDGRCPWCGGEDDLGCQECGGSLSCPECWGEGEIVEDLYVGPRVVTEYAFSDRGLL